MARAARGPWPWPAIWPDSLGVSVARQHARTGARRDVDRQPIELAMQRAAVDAQEPRRAGAVSVHRAEHGLDVLSLDSGPTRIVRARLTRGAAASLDCLGQIALAQMIERRHGHGILDGVLQFAHVARPAIGE